MTAQLFALKMKAARKNKGLDQIALADAIGTSQKNISVWENNKENIPNDKKQALCLFLGIEDNFAKQEQAPKTIANDQIIENEVKQLTGKRDQIVSEILSLDNFRLTMVEQYVKFLKDGEQ